MDNPIRITLLSQDKKAISIVEKVLKKSDEVTLQNKFADFNELIKELELNQEDFGILIIDFTLKEIGGMESLNQLSRDFPSIKKIVITQSDVNEIALESIRYGVKAILHHTKIKTELSKAILKVYQKKVHFDTSIIFLMVDELQKKELKREQKREQYRLRNNSCN